MLMPENTSLLAGVTLRQINVFVKGKVYCIRLPFLTQRHEYFLQRRQKFNIQGLKNKDKPVEKITFFLYVQILTFFYMKLKGKRKRRDRVVAPEKKPCFYPGLVSNLKNHPRPCRKCDGGHVEKKIRIVLHKPFYRIEVPFV